MSKQKCILIAILDGKVLGSWDGRTVSRDKIIFWDDHDADVELRSYKMRLSYRYPEETEVVKGAVNFDWDAMVVFSRSKNNPLRKRKTAVVG